MNHQLLPIVAVAVLTLATISVVRTQPTWHATVPSIAPPHADFEKRVAGVGLIESSSENISIAAHLPGIVEKVFVTVGREVKPGDPLVKLDTRALEAALAERRSTVATLRISVATATARACRARAGLAGVQRHLGFAESISDSRGISAEELTRRRSGVEIAEADVQTAEAEVNAAQATVVAAEATLKSVETEIDRSTVTAPIAGRILQVRIHPGEFAPAGPSATPWMVMGDVSVLNVRVDIDENEACRVRPNATAVAQVRGNASLQTPVKFVRFEPLIVPKQSLTGSSTERVDTRVLQAIYQVIRMDLPLFVGQQMDVFIDASDVKNAR